MLCYFRTVQACMAFGEAIYAHLAPTPNNERFFGRQQVRNQSERASELERLFGEILSNPRLIGAAWYCYQDQTVTGRDSKGECYPFGFVDITDTPYEEMTAASRKVSETMYAVRYGKGKENDR